MVEEHNAKPKRYNSRRGIPNKATADAREAISLFVNSNADRLVGWLDRVAKDNPKGAFECFMSVVEYHVPKLARTELTGKNEGAIQVQVITGVPE